MEGVANCRFNNIVLEMTITIVEMTITIVEMTITTVEMTKAKIPADMTMQI